jgi:hypothetical protein
MDCSQQKVGRVAVARAIPVSGFRRFGLSRSNGFHSQTIRFTTRAVTLKLNRFQEARTERPVNSDRSLDDPPGQRLKFVIRADKPVQITTA